MLNSQVEFAELSANGVHRVSEEVDHTSLVMGRGHPQATVGAIREAVEAALA